MPWGFLAANSPVLDAMLGSGMKEFQQKRIEFPENDPEEWKTILRCLDTKSAFLFDHLPDDRFDQYTDYQVNNLNVRTFVPWFHELQMVKYLDRCSGILYFSYDGDPFSGNPIRFSQEVETVPVNPGSMMIVSSIFIR